MEPLPAYEDLPSITGAPGSKLLCVLYSQNRLLVQHIATGTVWTQPFDYPAPDTDVPVPSAHGAHGPLPVELDNGNNKYSEQFFEMPGTNSVILVSTSKEFKSTVEVVDLATGHQPPISFVDTWDELVVYSVSEDLVYGYLTGHWTESECTSVVLDMKARRALSTSADARHPKGSPGVLLPHRAGLATMDPYTDYVEIIGFSPSAPVKTIPLFGLPCYICSPRVRDGSFLVFFDSNEESRCARYISFTAEEVGTMREMPIKCNKLLPGIFRFNERLQFTERGYAVLTRGSDPPKVVGELLDSACVSQM